ncbi:hypothetical protein Psed_6836 (plasmid) [Pseudonocardia dioxanivorans CB1190]|uniref:DUF2188 domain-containing protein n=1 Tax=Pseudonocardia dioxanivorans (strain ATCC 55486 / DSM 44775 / JCM 13855 / CB1190) TaxID=675635 RepID=F2L6L3_PSEUX|nr:hypothetical protein [Pseudonocardia dioxanivorans]AEA28907.1 hypothetical protein Psed_6836 [Pseudonocardia dioxanivorans CB1190]
MTGRWHRVRVHWHDGRAHDDAIRGRTAGEALANATANWITENPHGRAARVEHLPNPADPRAEFEQEPGART